MTSIRELLKELACEQEERLLATGRRIIPSLTADDMLQPNDFQELECNPHFRYEEGILAGILTVQAAVAAAEQD